MTSLAWSEQSVRNVGANGADAQRLFAKMGLKIALSNVSVWKYSQENYLLKSKCFHDRAESERYFENVALIKWKN